MTPKIITAIEHVRQLHPQVTRVYFDDFQRWFYTDDTQHGPTFGREVDTDILEAALDEAWENTSIPTAFNYDPATRSLTEIEGVTDIEQLTTQE